MNQFSSTLESSENGILAIALFVLASGMGLFIVRQLRGPRRNTHHHEVFGYFFAVAGGIYGVLLGLVVVNAMTYFDDAKASVTEEGSILTSIFMVAESQSPKDRDAIQGLAEEYVHSVLDDEWRTMATTGHRSENTHAILDRLVRTVVHLDNTRDGSYSQLLDLAHALLKTRHDRLEFAKHEIPTIEWFSLCLGGIIIIAFSYSFVLENVWVQLIGTMLLSTMIALNIYLVLSFSSPFSGNLAVSDQAFRDTLSTYRELSL
jgi:hypothetical protein